MKITLRFFSLLALAFILAASASAQCPTEITKLRVTFRDALGDKFRSDATTSGNSSYQTQKVKGDNIDIKIQSGNCDLTMNLNFTRRTAWLVLDQPLGGTYKTTTNSEFFNFDRVGSVPVTNGDFTTNTALKDFCKGALDTSNVVKNADGTYKYDNYAGCGMDSDGRYFVRRAAGIQAGDDSRGFRFQNSLIDGVSTIASGTSYIRVYRPTAKTWEISPEVMPLSSLGVLFNKSDNTIIDHYSAPFLIKLTDLR